MSDDVSAVTSDFSAIAVQNLLNAIGNKLISNLSHNSTPSSTTCILMSTIKQSLDSCL